MACHRVVSGLTLPLWEEVFWPFLDAWDSVRLRTTSTQCPREVRALWRALLLPSGEGANGPQGAESAGAQHPAEKVKAVP